MKKMGFFLGVFLGLFAYMLYQQWAKKEDLKCLFSRSGQCVTCHEMDLFPVGYKEDCEVCRNRKAYYVEEGLFPAWQCGFKKEAEDIPELPMVSVSAKACPDNRPLRDILGNCYSCDVKVPVKLAHATKGSVCGQKRYMVPDQLFVKSLKCPDLEMIKDTETCISCGGFIGEEECVPVGQNRFCSNNEECLLHEWCFPFRIIGGNLQGVCSPKSKNNWICSETDGFDLISAQAFCAAQNAHVPTLEEIESADEDLSKICPTLDIWTFFDPDGVVWLESFTQEFLFTREGESQKLGGHTFHALCHKD